MMLALKYKHVALLLFTVLEDHCVYLYCMIFLSDIFNTQLIWIKVVSIYLKLLFLLFGIIKFMSSNKLSLLRFLYLTQIWTI